MPLGTEGDEAKDDTGSFRRPARTEGAIQRHGTGPPPPPLASTTAKDVVPKSRSSDIFGEPREKCRLVWRHPSGRAPSDLPSTAFQTAPEKNTCAGRLSRQRYDGVARLNLLRGRNLGAIVWSRSACDSAPPLTRGLLDQLASGLAGVEAKSALAWRICASAVARFTWAESIEFAIAALTVGGETGGADPPSWQNASPPSVSCLPVAPRYREACPPQGAQRAKISSLQDFRAIFRLQQRKSRAHCRERRPARRSRGWRGRKEMVSTVRLVRGPARGIRRRRQARPQPD